MFGVGGELFQTGEAVGCPGAGKWHKSCQKGFLGLFSLTSPCSTVPQEQRWQLCSLGCGMRWGIKHTAQESWGVLPFNSTQEGPCLSFPLSHFPLSHRSRAGLFQSWQFKEERSNSMNSSWICCREFVSFTHLQGARSSTEVLAVWILQGLIKFVFATTTFLGGDGPPSFTFLWNVKFLQLSGWSSKVWSKGYTQDLAPQSPFLYGIRLRRGSKHVLQRNYCPVSQGHSK